MIDIEYIHKKSKEKADAILEMTRKLTLELAREIRLIDSTMPPSMLNEVGLLVLAEMASRYIFVGIRAFNKDRKHLEEQLFMLIKSTLDENLKEKSPPKDQQN